MPYSRELIPLSVPQRRGARAAIYKRTSACRSSCHAISHISDRLEFICRFSVICVSYTQSRARVCGWMFIQCLYLVRENHVALNSRTRSESTTDTINTNSRLVAFRSTLDACTSSIWRCWQAHPSPAGIGGIDTQLWMGARSTHTHTRHLLLATLAVPTFAHSPRMCSTRHCCDASGQKSGHAPSALTVVGSQQRSK